MALDRFVRNHGWALTVALVGGCAFFGGQTGETDSADCGPPIPIAFDEVSRFGFSGSEMLDQYGETWNGTARTSSGTAPDALVEGTVGETFPVSVSITYSGGVVLEGDCLNTFEIEVDATLEVGDGFISRAGTAILDGNLDEALLEVELAPTGDGSQEPATLMLVLEPDGTATGTVTLGDWWATVDVRRAP